MSYSTDVPDGATQRQSRMMELLTFVNLCEPRGVTITQIQSHMLTVFGLKFRTTSEMARELTVSGATLVDGHGFYHLTGKQQSVFKTQNSKVTVDLGKIVSPKKGAEIFFAPSLSQTLQFNAFPPSFSPGILG